MILCLFLLLVKLSLSTLTQSDIVYALHVNSSYVTKTGIQYTSDNGTFFQGSLDENSGTIKYTSEPEFYKSNRYDLRNYSLPLTEPGNYILQIKFLETFYAEIGKRVFNIALCGIVLFDHLDMF